MSCKTDFQDVTEISGDMVTPEQVSHICTRYYWAGSYCQDKDVLEAACGAGQGLGYLHSLAKSLRAGDYSGVILDIARNHYKDRIPLLRFDAQDMPFADQSFDVVILFEAIYYLEDVLKFISECKRVLRRGGTILIATANKDLYDFNPSPYSIKYFGVMELRSLLEENGFSCEFFGCTPVTRVSFRQRLFRPMKKLAVALHLIPKTMKGKQFLKRIVFGKLVHMPQEIGAETTAYVPPTPIPDDREDRVHKVIFCAAKLAQYCRRD